MKRVIGFAFFAIAAGMILMMFLPDLFVGIIVAACFLIIGYFLFCC